MVLSVFGLFLVTKIIQAFPKDVSEGLAFWTYTDWLIDYSSGFVRRGLSGELIDLASGYVHPRTAVAILAWILFLAVVLGYVRLLSRSIKTLPTFLFAALLFLPGLLPFYLYEHDAFGRKEIAGYLLLLYHLYALESTKTISPTDSLRKNAYIRKIFPLTSLLLPILILVHESSFLLFLPFHILITYTILRFSFPVGFKRQLFGLVLIYLPALLTFVVVFFWGRPAFEVAYNICRKWQLAGALGTQICRSTGNPMRALPGSFSALAWTFSQASSLPLSLSPGMVVAWLFNFLIAGGATVYAGSMTSRLLFQQDFQQNNGIKNPKEYARAMAYKYFLLPLLLSSPLYLLGWDLGRWFTVTCINYVIVSLSPELHAAEGRLEIKTRTVTISLYSLLLLFTGVILLTGFYPDWIGLGNARYVSAQLIRLGSFLLLAFFTGLWYEKYLVRNPDFEKGVFWYAMNVFLLLAIMIGVRVPYCCQHDGWKMLAEPIQSFIKSMIN
jgi:hypothetical protein